MKKIFAILMIASGISSAAQAGILVEPYLGYLFGDLKYKSASPGSTERTDSLGGLAYGMRLGYKFMLPWVAVDYTGFSGTGKNGTPNGTDYNYSGNALGAVVGIDLPVMFRFWGGYGFQNNFTRKGTDNNPDIKLTGTYTKVGLGFKGLPFVSINAEYIMNKHNKIDIGQARGYEDVSTFYSTFDANLLMVSVSMPFNF